MTKVYCFIPARGGSTRVPNKNLRPIGGQSLTKRAVITAQISNVFDEIFVSTDSDEIKNDVGDLCKVDKRPFELANDTCKIIDVLREFVERKQLRDDSVVGVLLTTCALRLPSDVQQAFAKFNENAGNHTVVSVSEYETPIHLAFFINEQGRLENVFPEAYKFSTRSVDHERAYRYNGAVLFRSVQSIKNATTLVGSAPIPFVMERERSIDIDWEYQMKLVTKLLENENEVSRNLHPNSDSL